MHHPPQPGDLYFRQLRAEYLDPYFCFIDDDDLIRAVKQMPGLRTFVVLKRIPKCGLIRVLWRGGVAEMPEDNLIHFDRCL